MSGEVRNFMFGAIASEVITFVKSVTVVTAGSSVFDRR
jgi:hypothetical protein